MENKQLMNIPNGLPDKETGLLVQSAYIAGSGLRYMAGVRDFGNLKIIEGVSKGTASIFLTSLMVFDQNGVLIYDVKIDKWCSYSREVAREMVLNGLIHMLREAAESGNKDFDELTTRRLVDEKLKTAYYQQSYKAVMGWAKELGIEIYEA